MAAQSAPSNYLVAGDLEDEFGLPVGNAEVCASRLYEERRASVACARTSPEGEFTLALDTSGSYELIPNHSSEGYHPPALPLYWYPNLHPVIVRVDGDRVTPASLRLAPRNGVLTGHSLDQITESPVEEVRFTLCHASDEHMCWSVSAKNEAGAFHLPAPHVPFTLKASAVGYNDWFGRDGMNREPLEVASDTTERLTVRLVRSDAIAPPLREDEKRTDVHLPAPVPISPADGAEFDVFPRDTLLLWKAVDGARSYGVEVDFCDGRVRDKCSNPQPLIQTVVAKGLRPSYAFTFLGSQPGRWRVWAVDMAGHEGFKSEWRSFFYLR